MDTTEDGAAGLLARLERAGSRTWALAGQERAAADFRGYGLAALGALGATLAMLGVRDALGVLNVALIYLLLCFALSLAVGAGPAALAAVLSFATYDYFFIPPYHTFSIGRKDHILALFVYLVVAVVTSQLVARVRERTAAAEREQRRTALLYELNAALIGDVTLDEILGTIVERVVHVYGSARARILLPEPEGELAVRARFPATAPDVLDRQQLAVATSVMERRRPAGLGAGGVRVRPPHGVRRPPFPTRGRDGEALYVPIATAERVIGVLEVTGRPGGGRFGPEDEALLGSFAAQAALAAERARLSDEAAKAAVLAQSDELKSALLAAVSHDLRTPLAAIKASATALLDEGVRWDESARREFLEAIDEETDRLTLMVGNLLDLSRIEGGALRPEREWYDLAELVADVVRRVRVRAGTHPVSVEIEPELPPLLFDYLEISQALLNLCENAVKYTPPGTPIRIAARRTGDAVEVAVHDEGPGIPPATLARLFEKFYRGEQGARVPGSGIGLTICKGLVEAHGGRIWAESAPGRGTTFRFTLSMGGGTGDGG